MMKAAVYVGNQTVLVEEIETPQAGPGELLVRVEACGICHTDLKKIEYDLLPAPRIYGHETAGVVVEIGEGVSDFRKGDRVVAFHHIPCDNCFYCARKLFAQCPVYKKVGITAGYEAAGGGFAQYVRIMDWIVRRGVERIPEGASFELATLVEPFNTVHKAVVQANPKSGDVCLVMGQGPIGLLFTILLHRAGARVIATDTMQSRLTLARSCGAEEAWNPLQTPDLQARIRGLTDGRGADMVAVAVSAPGIVDEAVRLSRPGAGILLFSQTSAKERIEVSGADICVGERCLFGSYSASVDLQKESARLVFGGKLPLEKLISHRLPLDQIQSGFELARRPDETSLKIVIQPQRWSW
ncbi:MAG: alcohol dehydrogenase catalytic domain-containing protein [Bryobacteraceae bacterium]|nr:alcohol dehydrogenase catalytic domain-containing protein [Bryobacteraceae bacterium]